MDIAIALGLAVVNLLWLAALVVTLPGTWGMLLTTALVAWWRWEEGLFHPATLAVLLGLTILAEVLESLGPMAGVKRAGGGRRESWLALIGGIVGAAAGTAIPVPLVGTLIGACIGAFVGAAIAAASLGLSDSQTYRIGWAAARGRLWATVMKTGIGGVMWIIITVASFWP